MDTPTPALAKSAFTPKMLELGKLRLSPTSVTKKEKKETSFSAQISIEINKRLPIHVECTEEGNQDWN
jgi:hypothetical protein